MSSSHNKPKVLAIVGPTASGKSTLAVTLARRFNGEVISADSRQIYRELNIGTGKITRREMQDVPHHLLDIVSPKRQLTVSEYKKKADKAVDNISLRGKLPILCGGTGFYIDAVLKNITFPEVAPQHALRKKLEIFSANTLYKKLARLDPKRAKTIDHHNKRRLIRALEILAATKKPIPTIRVISPYDVLKIGINLHPSVLRSKIKTRLLKRIKQGLIAEVSELRTQGLSWQRLDALGLEYRYVSQYVRNSKEHPSTRARDAHMRAAMIKKLEVEIWRYAKRQITWFKRDSYTHWINNPREATHLVQKFLHSKKRP
jgi:tRNA dimethylallyltransferase